GVRHRAEDHLPDGQARQPIVAHHADVELAAFDVLLDQSVGADLLMDELDPLLEPRRVLDHGSLRNTQRSILDRGLHEKREAELAWHADARTALEDGELRCGNAMEREKLFAQRLVTRQQQSARVAACVGLTHELEERNNVLVVRDDAVEFLEQVENDVGLPFGYAAAHLGQTVEHAETTDVVPTGAQTA